MGKAIAGIEEHQRPRFFAPLEARLESIRAKAKPLDVLIDRKPAAREEIEAAAADSGVPAERLRWLPVRHMKGFWTALIDDADGKPAAWIALDPYED